MKNSVSVNWIKIAFVNLLIVAVLGCLMRYKIGYSFPHLEQKFIQHAHSHFAFSGWITHVLFTLILYFSQHALEPRRLNLLRMLININLLLAYGMLISFFIQGYGIVSIVLSSLCAINSILFSISIIRDLKVKSDAFPFANWFKAGLLFNVISTAGTVSLAYMMGSGKPDQNIYLASVYYYLHFQYNGFFFFVCMGVFFEYFKKILSNHAINSQIFRLFFYSCIPAYLLSILWLNLPIWLLILVACAAIIQVAALILLVREVKRNSGQFKKSLSNFNRWIYISVFFALGIKIMLQLISTIPSLSELAFGFRPIVIAYLHLVLLAIISIFLINFFSAAALIPKNSFTQTGIFIFIAGVFFNEILLAAQGVSALSYQVIPLVNQGLFLISLMMLFGTIVMSIGVYRKLPLTTSTVN